jgi:hypothetical protein
MMSRLAGKPHATNTLRRALRNLMIHAIDIGLRSREVADAFEVVGEAALPISSACGMHPSARPAENETLTLRSAWYPT